jgi:hypothetical protein
MTTMKRTATAILTALLTLGMMAAPAGAQEPPPHDHTLLVPGTGDRVQVGPHRCAGGAALHTAFLRFHYNVHVGTPTDTGAISIGATLC